MAAEDRQEKTPARPHASQQETGPLRHAGLRPAEMNWVEPARLARIEGDRSPMPSAGLLP